MKANGERAMVGFWQLMKLERLVLALLLSSVCFAAPNQPVAPQIALQENDGFCEGGSAVPLAPLKGDPRQLKVWGGFCSAETSAKKVRVKTSPFMAPRYLRIYVIGWTGAPVLALERVSDGTRYVILPWDPDFSRWSKCDYALPADWQGKEVRLVVEGDAPKDLWRAFSEPIEGSGAVAMGDALRILGLTAWHFGALMSCGAALAVFAVMRGVRDRIQVGLIVLAGTAAPGYLIFWLTFASARWGGRCAAWLTMAAIFAIGVCIPKLDLEGRAVLRSLSTPLLLTGVAGLMVLSSGFLYGGWSDPLNKPRARFLPRLPPDNEIPFLLAKGVRLPHVPSPMQGIWLSSDRPPLQSGIVLAQYPLWRKAPEQGYSVVSVLAQSLWIFALWLLLEAFALHQRVVALVLAACLFTGFVFINTLFVWPKLLAAAYTLGFLATFVVERPKGWFLGWILPGALLSFSLLAHGGSLFALVTGVPMLAMWRRPWQIKRMGAVVLLAVLLYSPWLLYQKLYDPPGNRLLKIHLAGVEPLDRRSFGEALRAAYGGLTLGQVVSNKRLNFELAFGEGVQGLQRTGLLIKAMVTPGGLADAAARGFQLREQMFFHPAVCLGVFFLAPFALLAGIAKRFRTAEWRTACVFWIFTVITMVVWCLVMFGPYTTSIHQGAYAIMLLLMAAGVLSYWAVSPRLAMAATLVQVGVNFLLNEVLIRVPYSNGFLPEGMMHLDTAVMLGCSVVGVVALLGRSGRAARRDGVLWNLAANSRS